NTASARQVRLRRSGGIGRRASFRSWFPLGSGGSSPLFGSIETQGLASIRCESFLWHPVIWGRRPSAEKPKKHKIWYDPTRCPFSFLERYQPRPLPPFEPS